MGWPRPIPSSSCASARLAAAITGSPAVECRPTRPVRADLPPETIRTTTGAITDNPAEDPSTGSSMPPVEGLPRRPRAHRHVIAAHRAILPMSVRRPSACSCALLYVDADGDRQFSLVVRIGTPNERRIGERKNWVGHGARPCSDQPLCASPGLRQIVRRGRARVDPGAPRLSWRGLRCRRSPGPSVCPRHPGPAYHASARAASSRTKERCLTVM